MEESVDHTKIVIVGSYDGNGMVIWIHQDLTQIDSLRTYNGTRRFTDVIKKASDSIVILGESILESKCVVIELYGLKQFCSVGPPSTEMFNNYFNITYIENNITDRSPEFITTVSDETSELNLLIFDGVEDDVVPYDPLNETCGDVTYCFGVADFDIEDVCSGHGDCIQISGESDLGECVCHENYTVETDCSYYECFGVGYNRTDEVCTNGRGLCVGHDECDCLAGYSGSECEIYFCNSVLFSDTGSVCSGNGTCFSPDNCVCFDGYMGDDCESFGCFGYRHDDVEVCSRKGECIAPQQCSCIDGNYTYEEDCSIWKCYEYFNNETEYVCSSNGNCTSFDTCECSLNYTDDDCSVWYCNGTFHSDPDHSKICSGHGNCTAPETCDCEDNEESYFGQYCTLYSTTCFNISKNETDIVCGSHGRCLGLDLCVCDEGYDVSDDCSRWQCFGTDFDEKTDVCGGHGNCTLPDTCVCEFGYENVAMEENWECETFSCFGILEWNQSSVCGGHGNCTSYENCECESGYLYPECNTWECNGVLNTEIESVCSGHGSCVSPETCDCDSEELYEGEYCEKWKCYNISSSDFSNACSGHGICLDVDSCRCFSGYNGSICDEWECNSLPHDDPDVCSGRGECSLSEVCTCHNSYEGSDLGYLLLLEKDLLIFC